MLGDQETRIRTYRTACDNDPVLLEWVDDIVGRNDYKTSTERLVISGAVRPELFKTFLSTMAQIVPSQHPDRKLLVQFALSTFQSGSSWDGVVLEIVRDTKPSFLCEAGVSIPSDADPALLLTISRSYLEGRVGSIHLYSMLSKSIELANLFGTFRLGDFADLMVAWDDFPRREDHPIEGVLCAELVLEHATLGDPYVGKVLTVLKRWAEDGLLEKQSKLAAKQLRSHFK